MRSPRIGDLLVRRLNPSEPDGWERVKVIGSGIEGRIGLRPVDAVAGGIDADPAEVAAVYDVEVAAPEAERPRLSLSNPAAWFDA